MARQGRNLHIRLTDETAQRFDRLAAEFSGLPPGTVLRLMIEGQLVRPLDETVELIEGQIRPGGQRKRATKAGLNARSRITGE